MTQDLRGYRPDNPDCEAEPAAQPLAPETVPVPDEWTSQVTLDEVRRIYVKPNYHRFSEVFAECDAYGGMRPSLAVAPFFFGYLWFFYRKMYLEGFLVLMAGGLVLGVVQALAVNSPQAASIAAFGLNLSVSIILTIYAKAIYWKAVDRQIEKAMRLYPQDPARALSWLDNIGGVNFWIVVIALAIMVVSFGGLAALVVHLSDSGIMNELINL